MMKITDEQFIEAMKAVTKAQPGMIAAGNYMRNGAPYCVVGKALAHISQDLCPRDNTPGLALSLLVDMGCSTKVAIAAAVAQYANDVRQPFKVSGEVFEWAMTRVPDMTIPMAEASLVTRNLCREWELRDLMPYIEKPEPVTVKAFNGNTLATGGYVSVTKEFTTAMNNLATTISACSITINGVIAKGTLTVTPVSMLTKTEHALVA